MDHMPAPEPTRETTPATTGDTAGARRKHMRAQARRLRPADAPQTDGFATPQWLDHSFVLPLTRPAMTDVPSQSFPHHDDFDVPVMDAPSQAPAPAPAFVRPPTPEIDFARVIRRADLCRIATRATLGSTGLAGVSLVLYLLTGASLVLGMVIAFAVVTFVAVGVRLRLARASIPHL